MAAAAGLMRRIQAVVRQSRSTMDAIDERWSNSDLSIEISIGRRQAPVRHDDGADQSCRSAGSDGLLFGHDRRWVRSIQMARSARASIDQVSERCRCTGLDQTLAVETPAVGPCIVVVVKSGRARLQSRAAPGRKYLIRLQQQKLTRGGFTRVCLSPLATSMAQCPDFRIKSSRIESKPRPLVVEWGCESSSQDAAECGGPVP